MKRTSIFIRMPLLLIFLLFSLSVWNAPAQEDMKAITQLTTDGNTTVRILFNRLNANYVLPPLIFRVADDGSPNRNTAPIDQYGRSPYITFQEMKSLIHQLDVESLHWQMSSTKTPIEPFEKVEPNENVFITIYASNGMATTSIPPKHFCKVLSKLNNTIEMQRAHWEFEYFRRGCSCQVIGYKSDAYPNNR